MRPRRTRFRLPVLFVLTILVIGLHLVWSSRPHADQGQAATPQAPAQPEELTVAERQVVQYVLSLFANSKAGKPNIDPEAVKRDLNITLTPEMEGRIRRAVIAELRKIAEARQLVEGSSPAPAFAFPSLDGKPVTLSALAGKVVVVNFWASWCPPCLHEMPMLNAIYAQYKKQGVAVIGLSLDEGGLDVARPFVKKLNIQYPIAASDKATYQAYGNILTIPHTFVIDRKGIVQKRFIGNQERAVVEEAIKKAL